MNGHSTTPFAGLLRQLRADAGLTQEELAHAAQLSPRAVSDLERGVNRTARKDTARLLADALNLEGTARAFFEAAARGRGMSGEPPPVANPAGGVAGATRTLPRDVASFTGREADLRRLAEVAHAATDSAGVVGICAIGGMAGIGKTVFAVHAAHLLAPRFPDGQIFLSLHGHTAGQRPVDPADALASLLLTAGVAVRKIPPGLEARARLWRDHLAGKRLLLVLDDAAGHGQVQPLLPGTAGCLVLVTSRRHLTALEDTHTISLDTLSPGEAATLLIRLAGRDDLEPGDAAVGEIARLCGYLPLAVGLLGRQLHHHPAWTAAGLAAVLAAARDRLEFMHAENLSVAAGFDLSYQDLTADQQRLFRRLGLHPGTDIGAYSAAALAGTSLDTARRQLEALYDQHLLTEPAPGRYRLHDLIREHARILAAADLAADNGAAGARLLSYHLHTARAAARHFPRRSPGSEPAVTVEPPESAPDLPAPADAVRWMDAERLNLHAAATDAGLHDRHGHVIAIAAAMHGFLRIQGYWDQALALHHAAFDAARRAGDRLAEADALTRLGEMQHLTGDYPAAIANLTHAVGLCHSLGSQLGEASARNELGIVQQDTGDYDAAAVSHQLALELYRGLRSQHGEASALNELGLVQQMTGDYQAAAACHEQALRLYRDLGHQIGEASALNRLGGVQQAMGDYPSALAGRERALRLFRSLGYRIGEASALTSLGNVQRATGEYLAAAENLTAAVRLSRDLGSQLGEARALNNLGLVQQDTGDYPAAAASHERALQLFRDLGSQLGEAQALRNLGLVQQEIGGCSAAESA